MVSHLEFPRLKDWPTPTVVQFSGLAFSWHGPAWVWSTLIKKNYLSADDAYFRGIELRLRNECARPIANRCSHLIGSASSVILSAQINSKILLNQHLRRWKISSEKTVETDLMFGCSGALLAACELEDLIPGSVKPEFIRFLFQKTSSGLQKILKDSLNQPVLLGLSHGVAGHVLALEAASYKFSIRYKPDLIKKSLELLNQEQVCIAGRNAKSIWPWFSQTQNLAMQSWCHGAPGIALAFLRLSEISKNSAYSDIALRALNATALMSGRPLTASTSFCCGSLGRAHILLYGYKVLAEKYWMTAAKKAFMEAEEGHYYGKRYGKSFHQGKLGQIYFQFRIKDPTLPILGCVF